MGTPVLLEIVSQAHFWWAVCLPGVITTGFLIAGTFQRTDLASLSIAIILTCLQTPPLVQSHLHILGRPMTDLQVLPIYPLVLLIQLPRRRINLGQIFAGTFLAGLAADVLWSMIQPCCSAWFGIGGGGVWDGLLVQPVSAVMIGLLANFLRDRRLARISLTEAKGFPKNGNTCGATKRCDSSDSLLDT